MFIQAEAFQEQLSSLAPIWYETLNSSFHKFVKNMVCMFESQPC